MCVHDQTGFAVEPLISRVQVLLFGQVPPIDKMDASLSSLKACK